MLRAVFENIRYLFAKIINLFSFGLLGTTTRNRTRKSSLNAYNNTNYRFKLKYNDSLDCLSSSSNSSDSDGENPAAASERRKEQNYNAVLNRQTEIIANEAVAHSYEDITQPDYRNYLWLSSQWDRTDLFSSLYFLLNWAEHFKKQPNDGINTEYSSSASFTFICHSFIEYAQKLSSLPDAFYPRRRLAAPKKLKTLILDLDETLIHSTAASCSNFDFMVEVLVNRTSCLYYVYKRPNLDHFLNVASNWFNLIIYTASVREYADPVIDLIDENGKFFKKRLFRTDCTQTPSAHYLKDISIVDADISKICLLDNSAASFAFYPDNAIPIESWRDDPKDSALLDLLPFLDALRFVDDVRSILSLRRLLLFCNK